MSVIGARIKEARIRLQLTQEELADIIGSTQKQIWRYESGKSLPSLDTLNALANALDTTTDWLIGRVDELGLPVGNRSDLSDNERRLLELYRSKSPEMQDKLMEIAKVV